MNFLRLATLACTVALLGVSNIHADIVSGINTDPMADGLVFGGNDLFAFGGYGAAGGQVDNGNSAAVMTFTGDNNAGHGNSVPIDPSTLTTFEDGDVVRYTMWAKLNPQDPFNGSFPQIAPLLKFEFHNNQLDGGGSMKQFDTEQNAGLFTSVTPGDDWAQFSYEYVINANDFQGGGLGAVQEIRAVLFAGEFTGGSAASGGYLIDNIAVEWFADINDAAANPASQTVPGPVKIPEPSSLVVLALATMACRRRRS